MAAAEVNSVATRRFWDLFQALPDDVQKLAVKNYHLWRRDPHHPSLRSVNCRAARIASAFALEIMLTWVWIGTHTEYDRVVGLLGGVGVSRQVDSHTVQLPDDA